ncbi:MFS transporter [Streptomyces sp. SID3343]|uniref:MFS transporter n=1 Tax=Streptomyces sp. SID3343 TaxID=2690260 RepID=UPI00136C2EC1|nr:MFS transporter [Streptomyces sp. SID3343]MYV98900.1 MFS transporter [Streptomyces sp. SID3343]
MSSTTTEAPGTSSPAPEPAAGADPAGYKLAPLYATLPVANIALYMLWLGVGIYLLPMQVIHIKGVPDQNALKWPLFWGSLLATVGNPLFGKLSDMTRSRFGRRSPYILFCALIGAGALCLQANANSIAMVALTWGVIQFIMNGYQAAVTAVMPDRVPAKKYGMFSAMIGLGTPVATIIISLIIAGVDLNMIGIDAHIGGFDGRFANPEDGGAQGFYLIAAILAAAAIVFVIVSPDKSTKDMPTEKFAFGEFVKGFRVSPREHSDFFIALFSRLGVMLGYMVVLQFNYFILLMYIKIPMNEVTTKLGTLTVVGAVVTVFSAIVIGPIVDRVGRVKPFVIGAGVGAALSLMIPLLWPSEGGMIAFNVVNGFFFGMYMAVDMALITQVLPRPKDVGKDMGLINIANAGPQIASPFLAPFLVDDLGMGYKGLFAFAAAVSLLGALLALLVKRVK